VCSTSLVITFGHTASGACCSVTLVTSVQQKSLVDRSLELNYMVHKQLVFAIQQESRNTALRLRVPQLTVHKILKLVWDLKFQAPVIGMCNGQKTEVLYTFCFDVRSKF
jgi:hypothetical protein